VYQAKQPFETLLLSAGWPTIDKATKDYLRWMEHQADKSPRTIQSARLLLEKVAVHFGKDRTLDSISHEEIEEYKTKLIDAGVTSFTAELQLVRLRALYNWLADREMKTAQREKRTARALYVPIDSEITQSRSTGRSRFLLQEEAQKVLAATPDSLLFPVAIGLLAGLRLDEVCHLRPPPLDLNFDVAGGVIIIPREIDLGGDRKWRPKSKKRREIPMAAQLVPIAKRHLELYASPHWMCPHPRIEDRPLDKNILGGAFLRIVEDAGLGCRRARSDGRHVPHTAPLVRELAGDGRRRPLDRRAAARPLRHQAGRADVWPPLTEPQTSRRRPIGDGVQTRHRASFCTSICPKSGLASCPLS
jgi:integrase